MNDKEKIADDHMQKVFWVIQTIFGVVVGRSLITFTKYFIPNIFESDKWPVVLAFFTVNIFVLWSWIDFSYSFIKYPYKLREKGTEILRCFIDFFIVLTYIYLTAWIDFIDANKGQQIKWFFFSFTIVFAFYLVSGLLREAMRKNSSNITLIVTFLILFFVHNVAYSNLFKDSEGASYNTYFILAALALTIAYRVLRYILNRMKENY